MTNEICISLRPEMAELVRLRKKNHEFRRYKLPYEVRRLWIYVTMPVSELKYIAEIGELVEYPTNIPEDGVGNTEFNKGLKKSKYAYPILHLDELVEPLNLQRLREEFGFSPPQRFVYTTKYQKLVDHFSSSRLRGLY